MSVLAKAHFYDEKAAFEHVESILWQDGPVCGHCGGMDKAYKLTGIRTKPSKKNPEGIERHGLYKCGHCRKQFTVRKNTIFEESAIPLHKWLQAIHLMCSSKKGISSNQLARVLEITVKSAWFLSHRIREAMCSDDLTPMGGSGKVVEADETYIGKKEVPYVSPQRKGRPMKSNKHGGVGNKLAVVSLVERGGRVRSFHPDHATKASVTKIVWENIDHESTFYTDESRLYTDVRPVMSKSDSVKHSAKEYVRGDVHTNTVEGYYSIFKRGMNGVYQHCKEKHLHRYLAEYDFRYNNRIKLGCDDIERAERALRGITGKRLTYRGAYQG
ncbi:MAG: IS1595 family transposase [Rhizobiaceae bacterium]|nr:IS1595 family transposase [Rhizobiaceae bacterium]